jgi:hypothetical protein
MRLWLVALLLGLVPVEARAASCPDITTAPFHINFLGKTENFVSSLETHDFEMVVVGVVNGIVVSPVIGAPPACADLLSACIQGRSPTQFSAMVAKHIRETPSEWNEGIVEQIFNVVFWPCVQADRAGVSP